MAFPTSPINGQQAIVNGILYTYASATQSWTRIQGVAGNITLTGTLTGATVNAATIGNTGASIIGNLTGAATTATTAQYVTGLTSGNVTTALGYTPISDTDTYTAISANVSSINSNVTTANTGMKSYVDTGLSTKANLTGATFTGAILGTSVNAATIGNAGASITGDSVNAATIGNSGATLTGTLSTAAQTNITSVGTLTGLTVSATVVPNSNVSVDLGSTSAWWANVYGVTFVGVATTAKYADLAENYQADCDYSPGTVVVFGGTNEVTQSTVDHDTAIAGVVSTAPAYLMNSDLQTNNVVAVALAGRVPCRVQGPVSKGTVLVSSQLAGVAQAIDNAKFAPGCIIGKAMEDIVDISIQTIEISVGRS